ncbi:MAG: hypothetical protein ABI977_13250 [Acidobacteriota bacterium]
MKMFNKRWRPSPMFVVIATTVIVIAGTMLLGWMSARNYRVKARVEIADPVVETSANALPALANASSLPDGEVARMATRVREATGLLMGLALLAVTEQMNNRALTKAEALIDLMAQRNLFPPGIRPTTAQGVLSSDRATIYVRYRSQPLSLEVVSIGRERIDGAAVVARLTAGGDDNSSTLLFVSKSIEGVKLPEPFAPLSAVAALNWSIEPLRERQFLPQEIENLNVWAQQYANK